MSQIHTYDLKQIPRHYDSVDRQDEFEFELYKCLQHKVEKSKIQSTCLVIGYVNESPKKYVVLENAPVGAGTGTSSIKLHYVKKNLIERDFELVVRPDIGILRFPRRGDTVFCLAKDRYQGASGGKEYKVLSMYNNRVDVNGNDYTYEPEYFAVITGHAGRSAWPGTKKEVSKKIIDSSGGMKSRIFDSSIGSSHFKISMDKPDMVDAMRFSTAALFDKSIDFGQLLDDEDAIQKREQLDSGKLLSRVLESEEKEEKRGIYKPETINRKVIN